MDFNFSEILILLLVSLLFAKDYILPTLLKKLGLGNGKNSNGYQLQIDELKEHVKIANSEMGEIRKDISDIKSDISFIKGKLDK